MQLAHLHQKWAIVLLRGKRPIGAYVRLMDDDGIDRIELDVPASEHHLGYLAILSPDSVLGGIICTEAQARAFNLAEPNPFMSDPTIFADDGKDAPEPPC